MEWFSEASFSPFLLATTGVAIAILLALATRTLHNSRRRRRIRRELPAFLRSLHRLTRAGHAPAEALQIATRNLPGPLGEELSRVCSDQLGGASLIQAMRSLAERMQDSTDLCIFTHAVVLTAEHGGDLSKILPRLERSLSRRIQVGDEAAAETSQVRMNSVIMGAMGPAAAGLIWLIEPSYLQDSLEDPLGRLMCLGAAGWMCVGIGLVTWLLWKTE